MSTLPLPGVNTRFLPPSRFSLKMSRFFVYFELEKMRSMRSAQLQVELRRLGNQLPVLGKGTSMILKVCFVIQDHHLIVPYTVSVCKMCVCFVCDLVRVASRRCTTVPVVPPRDGKILTPVFSYALSRFFVR